MTKNMRRSRRWGLGQVKQVQGGLTDIKFKESHFSKWLSNLRHNGTQEKKPIF